MFPGTSEAPCSNGPRSPQEISRTKSTRSRFAMRAVFSLALVVGAGSLPACRCIRDGIKPEVEYVRVRSFEFDMMAGPQMVVDTTVRVNNRNGIDVTVRGLNANVSIAGQPIAPIAMGMNQLLPKNQETLLVFPVKVPGQTVLGILQATVGRDKLPYKVVGRADVTALGIDKNNEPFEEEGTIPRSKVLDAARGMFPGVPIQ